MSVGLVIFFFIVAVFFSVFGGVLAAADAAYSVSSRTDLDKIAEDHRRQRKQILTIAEDRTNHLSTVHFVRVSAETFSAVLITVALSTVFQNIWITLFVAAIVMSLVIFVLMGASPRSVGLHYPVFMVTHTARLIRVLRLLLGPVSTILVRLADRVSPGQISVPGNIKDEQQLLSMVDRAVEQDLIEEDEQDIIHSVVEFGETVVREVMVPRTDMVTIDAASTITETFELLLSSRHSRIPVTSGDSDDIVGVAYLRDIAGFVLRHSKDSVDTTVARVMKPAKFISDLQRADELLKQMQRESNHLALAVDEYGGIAGLVTLEDLIEELIGDIFDEHDREAPEAVELEPGAYRVSARLDIEELGKLFHMDLDDDDIETVGGLITKHLGRLAERGDVVVVSGIKLTVLETERKKQRMLSARAQWVGEPTPGQEPPYDEAEHAQTVHPENERQDK